MIAALRGSRAWPGMVFGATKLMGLPESPQPDNPGADDTPLYLSSTAACVYMYLSCGDALNSTLTAA